jgi:hypothetical protein
VLRDRLASTGGCLAEASDEIIAQLLTTVFFAGLETYEGERNPIGVAFLGKSRADFAISEGAESAGALLYQWKILQFESPRPFAIGELVKLAVAGVDRRIYSAVRLLEDGTLAISGLAREGLSVNPGPFVTIVASRPGCLFIRSGRDLLLGYERGAIFTEGDDVVLSIGPVRRALEATAGAAGLDGDIFYDYLDAVRSLVREMAAHGRGGILIISPDEHPKVAESATYRMMLDSSVASLLRMVQRINRKKGAETLPRPRLRDPGRSLSETAARGGEHLAFGDLFRNALQTEVERVIEELSALTGIDGAILLSRDLALVAFGVILPVGRPTVVAEAMDTEGSRARILDLSSRGTRHRASVTYAARHPGSVVFVASEDGQISCLFRRSSRHQVLLWRVGPAGVHM